MTVFDEVISRENTQATSVDGYHKFFDNGYESTWKYQGDDIIRMWIADMEIATPLFIREAIVRRLNRAILGYSKVNMEEFVTSVNHWYKSQYDFTVNASTLRLSSGIVPALRSLVKYCTKSDEKVIIFTPSYAPFKRVTLYHDRELVTSHLINNNGHYDIDFDDFESKLKDEKVTLCIFCHPHNPTGRVWTTVELQKVSSLCKQYNVTLISDEIHCDLYRSHLTHEPMAKVAEDNSHIITCFSTSKTFNTAGLMMACVDIPQQEIREEWDKHEGTEVNPLSYSALVAAYEEGEDYLKQFKQYLDKNFTDMKAIIDEQCPDINFIIPDSTYLAWLDCSKVYKGDNIVLFLAKEAGIICEDENYFVENGKGYIRLNIAHPNHRVKEATYRLCKAFNSQR